VLRLRIGEHLAGARITIMTQFLFSPGPVRQFSASEGIIAAQLDALLTVCAGNRGRRFFVLN